MEGILATVSETVKSGVTKVGYDLAFPNLGIFIKNLKNTIHIGNFTIAYYGIIIAIGMLIAFTVVISLAKKKKISEDYFYDLFIIIIVLGIIGARAYYVIFNWDYYQLRMHEILNIRAGGLAVFGGIIASLIGVAVYCKIKKCNFLQLVDLSVVGLAIGQAIGRYGNFFNMEAYGTYTNNLLAMRMNMQYLDPANIDLTQLANVIEEGGARYIQAHPTFFYESALNIILFIILLIIFNKFYDFTGKLLATYLVGYGAIRFFVESLRTDSLMFGALRASQVVAVICVIIGMLIYIIHYTKGGKKTLKESERIQKTEENKKPNVKKLEKEKVSTKKTSIKKTLVTKQVATKSSTKKVQIKKPTTKKAIAKKKGV